MEIQGQTYRHHSHWLYYEVNDGYIGEAYTDKAHQYSEHKRQKHKIVLPITDEAIDKTYTEKRNSGNIHHWRL